MSKFDDIVAKIRFISKKEKNIDEKNRIAKILDEALKKSGDFGVYGNLSSGLENLVNDFIVTITEKKKAYFIDCGPLSGYGHDCQFSINKKLKIIDKNSVCVGEVIAPPDLNDED